MGMNRTSILDLIPLICSCQGCPLGPGLTERVYQENIVFGWVHWNQSDMISNLLCIDYLWNSKIQWKTDVSRKPSSLPTIIWPKKWFFSSTKWLWTMDGYRTILSFESWEVSGVSNLQQNMHLLILIISK